MTKKGGGRTRSKRPRKQRQPGQPWTVRELADEARVSDAHIYDLVNKGVIDAMKFGAAVRIPDPVAQRLLGRSQTAA